jgi:hypothetical protein
MKWSYGITTVPSRVEDGMLKRTVASLARSGFDEPTLFIDGAAECLLGLPLVIYCPPVGAIANWMTALFHLYTRNPVADRYALFEDDLLTCSNLRAYLERCPLEPNSYLNLLTHDCNLAHIGPDPGWHPSNQLGKGAVGLVFDNQGVKNLLTSPRFINAYSGPPCADGMVIEVLKPLGYVEYVHNPSLLQHVGLTSTIENHAFGPVLGFVGTDYDPLTLLEGTGT